MAFEIKGVIYSIGQTNVISQTFKKREFVLEITEDVNGNQYKQYVPFQCTQAKCDILDRYSKGSAVTVHFNLKGRISEKNGKEQIFSNLDVWKIEAA